MLSETNPAGAVDYDDGNDHGTHARLRQEAHRVALEVGAGNPLTGNLPADGRAP
jgi:hypothetical protein